MAAVATSLPPSPPALAQSRARSGASLRIEDREELLYLLNEAAELEHGAGCSYLFAAYSLKTSPSEGLTPEQAETVAKWKQTLTGIAVQEMMHLALVTNLLTAVGGAPHLQRPSLPQRSAYAPEIQLALTPFDEQTLERFLYLERPEGMDLAGLARDFDISGPRVPVVTGLLIMPEPQDFSSVGQLYRGIEQGLRALVAMYGEAQLFIGAAQSQAAARAFRGLTPVHDLASALQALEAIVAEGEGQRGDWRVAHFGSFLAILEEYRALKQADPSFAPARPVLANPYARMPQDSYGTAQLNLYGEGDTGAVSDLFNACYGVMLQLLERIFQHEEENDAEEQTLSDVAIGMMTEIIRPLGELLTILPAGPLFPGMTVGPNFLIDGRTQLTANKQAAWFVFHERLLELAAVCGWLTERSEAAARLGDVRRSLEGFAARLAS
jgi:hypothetical protein